MSRLDDGICGIREFQGYIDSQGVDAYSLFQTLFAVSADRVAKTAFDKFIKGDSALSISDIYSATKGLITSLSRPIYIRFLSVNGKSLAWIKLGLNDDGTIKIAEELFYGIVNGDFILHGAPGIISRDDWLRDYIFIYHNIQKCSDRTITASAPEGGTQQTIRTVCVFTENTEYVP